MMSNKPVRKAAALLVIALIAAAAAPRAKASTPTYQITPTYSQISLGGVEPLTLNTQNQPSLRTYGFAINVTSPSGGQSFAITNIATSSQGNGLTTLNYPNDFHSYPGQPNTNRTGVYVVTVYSGYGNDEGGASIVATATFKVVSGLTVSIVREVGWDFLPGEPFSLTVDVRDVNNQSLVAAKVTGSVSGTDIAPTFNSVSMGEYATSFTVTTFIPENSQLTVHAQDALGNTGRIILNLSPSYNSIIVDRPLVTDQQGQAASEVSAGQTIYFGFRAHYANRSSVTSGYANVVVLMKGRGSTTLPAQYSQVPELFVTAQGFQLPENSSSATMQVRVLMADSTGSKGSTAPTTIVLALAPIATRSMLPSFVAFLPAVVLLAGSGASVYTLRKAKRQLSLRELRQALLQNKKHSLLITGSGKVGPRGLMGFLHGLLNEDLAAGVTSIYLNFEVGPAQLMANMINAGINVVEQLQNGLLKVLDCSDLNASLELNTLRLRIASALERVKSENFSLYVDSLRLPFEDIPTDQVMAFLWELSDEVIRRRGTLYSTLRVAKSMRKGLPQIREAFDSLFEVTAQNTNSKGTTLSVAAVNEAMQRRPLGDLKLMPGARVCMEVPLTSSLEKKVKES